MNLELSSRLMRCRIALTAVGLNGAVIGRPEKVFYNFDVSSTWSVPLIIPLL